MRTLRTYPNKTDVSRLIVSGTNYKMHILIRACLVDGKGCLFNCKRISTRAELYGS